MAGGLPEVIYTSDDDRYLHLPGLIVAESAAGDLRYLMPDGLGSVRQAVDSQGEVTVYHEFDPYGSPVENGGDPYGFTGEWWEDEVALLHLRARWYAPGVGVFLSRDPVEGEPPYAYVRGNPVNFIDPSGAIPYIPDCQESLCKVELLSTRAGGVEYAGHFAIAHVDRKGASGVIEAVPDPGLNWQERIINQKNLFDVGFPYYWNPVRHPYSTDAGILISQIRIGSTPDVIREFKETFQADSLLVAEGAEACNLWKCLQESMMQVEKNEIGYMLLGPNSNSAAISVLRKCQLPWRAPARDLAQITGRPHPGWILYLLGPLANTRIDRKDNYEFWLEITRPQLIQH